MGTINLAEDLMESLGLVQGKDIEEKISHLIETNILLQLRECEEHLFRFESRYGMAFEGFAQAWEAGEIEGKHSHGVERDFMEWEGFDLERSKLLRSLRELRLRTGR